MNDADCELNGETGICTDGVCGPVDLCDPPDCDDGNECTLDSCTDNTCANVPDEGAAYDSGSGTCDSSGQCVPDPSCGDGNLDPGEECDDGNTVDGDGCESDCTITPSDCPKAATGTALAACRNSFNQTVSTFPIDLTVAPDDCPSVDQGFNADATPIDPTDNYITFQIDLLRNVTPRGRPSGTSLAVACISMPRVCACAHIWVRMGLTAVSAYDLIARR